MLEQIIHDGAIMALIIRKDHQGTGVSFFTPPEFSQQLAFMSHASGKIITPHVHNVIPRSVQYTQEVLVIRKGKLRVDFYTDHQEYLESRELVAGDIILLAAGGHGMQAMEDLEMVEVKQGPYAGDADKVVFHPAEAKNG